MHILSLAYFIVSHVSMSLIRLAVPKVQFVEPEVEINENDGNVSVTIIRSGDLSIESTVRCYTRQGSAQVMMDYDERPNNLQSVITFLPGTSPILSGSRERANNSMLMVEWIVDVPFSDSPFQEVK